MTKTLRYLGLAKRAGRVVTGMDTCQRMMGKGRVALLIITEDTSPGSRKKAVSTAEGHGVRWVLYGTSEELSHMTGTKGKHIFGITDGPFGKTIMEAIEGEQSAEAEGNHTAEAEKENKEVSGWQSK